MNREEVDDKVAAFFYANGIAFYHPQGQGRGYAHPQGQQDKSRTTFNITITDNEVYGIM